jgi:adenylosuccinate synthase
MVDYFVRDTGASLVVKSNGGPHCAHNVVTPDGRHHTFSQVGAGALAGAHTFISKHMLVDPFALWEEIGALVKIGTRPTIAIDPEAVVVTIWHRCANRIREAARKKRHGSVGLGIGEARRDDFRGTRLRIADLADLQTCWEKLKSLWILQQVKLSEIRSADPASYEVLMGVTPDTLVESYARVLPDSSVEIAAWGNVAPRHEAVVFEGGQGVLLDERHGFAPHNTWTDCTFNHPMSLCAEHDPNLRPLKVGVIRSYHTRHGAGPFPSELPGPHLEKHNATHPYMGEFRTGMLDMEMLRYATQRSGPDCIALTHMDARLHANVCSGYRGGFDRDPATFLSSATPDHIFEVEDEALPPLIEEYTGVPVHYLSMGATASQKEKRPAVCVQV